MTLKVRSSITHARIQHQLSLTLNKDPNLNKSSTMLRDGYRRNARVIKYVVSFRDDQPGHWHSRLWFHCVRLSALVAGPNLPAAAQASPITNVSAHPVSSKTCNAPRDARGRHDS